MYIGPYLSSSFETEYERENASPPAMRGALVIVSSLDAENACEKSSEGNPPFRRVERCDDAPEGPKLRSGFSPPCTSRNLSSGDGTICG